MDVEGGGRREAIMMNCGGSLSFSECTAKLPHHSDVRDFAQLWHIVK